MKFYYSCSSSHLHDNIKWCMMTLNYSHFPPFLPWSGSFENLLKVCFCVSTVSRISSGPPAKIDFGHILSHKNASVVIFKSFFFKTKIKRKLSF